APHFPYTTLFRSRFDVTAGAQDEEKERLRSLQKERPGRGTLVLAGAVVAVLSYAALLILSLMRPTKPCCCSFCAKASGSGGASIGSSPMGCAFTTFDLPLPPLDGSFGKLP